MTNFDTSSGLSGGAILRLTVTQISQNTGANQSTDSWSLTLIKGTYSSFNLSGVSYSGSINGTPFSGSFTFDFRSSSSVLIASSSQTVTHNSDGTKTISVSGSIASTATSTGGPATTSGSFAQTTIAASVPTGAVVSRLSHTLTQPFEYFALGTTEAVLLSAIDATTPEIMLATLPATLSVSPVSSAGLSGSALDLFNEVIKSEQGYIYTATTGTVTTPAQVVKVRERTRGVAVDYSYDTILDVQGAIHFVRDSTNIVSTLTTTGPTQSVVLQDSSITARAGSASTTESVLFTQYVDVLAWGQDRLIRGKNANLRAEEVTIDAMVTSSDRSAALLAMLPGDHIQVTGGATAQIGSATYDGWLLGASEHHSLTEHAFQLFLAPTLSATAVYDTNRYMADGALSLVSGIISSDTTMSVNTSNVAVLLETVQVPYDLMIDSEQVTVTACTGATPQVATITRGVNGTVAASHSTSSVIEVATASLYAF